MLLSLEGAATKKITKSSICEPLLRSARPRSRMCRLMFDTVQPIHDYKNTGKQAIQGLTVLTDLIGTNGVATTKVGSVIC